MESKDVGRRIAMLRKQHGWSQMELAERLNVTDKAISKWENGGMPSVDLFPKLAKLFNVSIDYLMLGNGQDDYTASEAPAELTEQAEYLEEEPPATDLERSLEELTSEELDLILFDQHDLYSKEELQTIKALYEKKLAEEQEHERILELKRVQQQEQAFKRSLPKNYVCPMCDGINADPDRFCEFCNFDFYQYEQKPHADLGCLGYLVAFFFPLAGLIWSAIKGDKGVLTFSIVMLVLNTFFGLLSNLIWTFLSSAL